ncbi:uncharacterized protein LOC131946013 [Physella acuta]|uniref:uncharacterized protein LOC131946013 n=1 Tax=Physella acuta TaxID=109671 RepID=UPI0027DE1077|nr:uncharacterized protein LOC131946013 [Physella acuta]
MASEAELLDLDQLKRWELALTIPVHLVVAGLGLVSNVINIRVFLRLGLNNSMAVGVFSLSLTDLLITCLQLGVSSCFLAHYLCPASPLDLWNLGTFTIGWLRYACYYISCWVTTMVAVERCFCVVSPFKVKAMFTRARCVFVVMVIYIAHIGLVLPVYVIQRLDWMNSSEILTNHSSSIYKRVLAVDYNDQSAQAEVIIDTLGAVSLSILSQVILLVCTFWMIYSLKSSTTVRQINTDSVRQLGNDSNLPASHKLSKLSDREKRLVKVVLFLALVMTACNVPRFIGLAAHHLIPGLNGGDYRHLNGFIWDVSDFFGTLNCSMNLAVYWMLNSKFRNCLRTLCGGRAVTV